MSATCAALLSGSIVLAMAAPLLLALALPFLFEPAAAPHHDGADGAAFTMLGLTCAPLLLGCAACTCMACWIAAGRDEDRSCPHCGYDLRGGAAATACPECGTATP